MGRMRSWNSSEYESCGLQPYEISKGGRRREREEEKKRKEEEEDLFFMWRVEELLDEVCMSEERNNGKGHWVRASFYFRIDYVNKRSHLRVVLKKEIKSFSDMLRIPRRL